MRQDIKTLGLNKLATSRWREAIRSGELGAPLAESLKARMGVNPVREAEGLIQGWKNRASRAGYRASILTPRSVVGGVLGGRGKEVATDVLGALASGSPSGYVNPVLKTTASAPLGNALIAGISGPEDFRRFFSDSGFRKQLQGAILGHEGSELGHMGKALARGQLFETTNPALQEPMESLGKQIGSVLPSSVRSGGIGRRIRDTVMGQFATTGRHADPKVLLEEFRNTRLLSPEVQNTMSNLRRNSGELELIQKMTGGTGSSAGLLPRKRLSSIGRGMLSESGASRAAVASAFDRGLRSSTPLTGNVMAKLKSLFG